MSPLRPSLALLAALLLPAPASAGFGHLAGRSWSARPVVEGLDSVEIHAESLAGGELVVRQRVVAGGVVWERTVQFDLGQDRFSLHLPDWDVPSCAMGRDTHHGFLCPRWTFRVAGVDYVVEDLPLALVGAPPPAP